MSVTAPARVAGIEVSPDHFIDGARVASAQRFEVISPIDQSVLAEVARGDADDVDRAVRAAHEAFPGWAALGPAGRARHLHRLAELIDANIDVLAAVECADMAMLLRSLRARVIARGARNFRSYADLAAGYAERDWRSERHLEPRPADAGRSRGGNHAVERAVHAVDLEVRSGVGRGVHRRAEARGVVAAVLLAPGRPDRRGGLSTRGVQRRCRASARRPERPSSPTR